MVITAKVEKTISKTAYNLSNCICLGQAHQWDVSIVTIGISYSDTMIHYYYTMLIESLIKLPFLLMLFVVVVVFYCII